MKTSDIRQKLHQYIDTAQEKKVKVIFAMVEEIEEADDHWQDEEFINELKKTRKQLSGGNIQNVYFTTICCTRKKSS